MYFEPLETRWRRSCESATTDTRYLQYMYLSFVLANPPGPHFHVFFFLPKKTTWEKHKIPKKNCSKKIFSKDGGFPPVHTLSPGEFEAPVHILYLNVIQPWRIMEPPQKIGVFPTTKWPSVERLWKQRKSEQQWLYSYTLSLRRTNDFWIFNLNFTSHLNQKYLLFFDWLIGGLVPMASYYG